LTAPASYYDVPYFYITDLGPNKDPSAPGEVYQIDALGYGGTANTVAVVESTYLISTNSAHGGDK
jgi:Tfp pilus assembly protein PilX